MSSEKVEVNQFFQKIQSSPRGLNLNEVQRRQALYGANSIVEKKESLFVKIAKHFWGPIPWMIEAAALLSLFIHHYPDFVLITTLLLFNALLAFWQEYQAGNAIELLKKKMAIKTIVLRDGEWKELSAEELVPGDVIKLRLGDIIPADGVLFEGDFLIVDQSILTGESLAVDRTIGDMIYSGAIVQKGQMQAIVSATGIHTLFGRTVHLVETSQSISHFQKNVMQIGKFLVHACLYVIGFMVVVQISRHASLTELLKFSLLLIVASIPVAMPAVLTVTMAIGALALSKMKSIVTRLESIEEMAGVDTLCCDKTGTLTYNKLIMGTPYVCGKTTVDELVAAAVLASEVENADPIDRAIFDKAHTIEHLDLYRQTHFTPFDPIDKRTEAVVQGPENEVFRVTKGAPDVILALCKSDDAQQRQLMHVVQEYARKGYRTLGVAKSDSRDRMCFLGIIPLYDQIRDDALQTIQEAHRHGIDVKMLTGDHQAIAQEVAREVGIGTRIYSAREWLDEEKANDLVSIATLVERADGFSQVFPESKHVVVRALQSQGHIVAMTGDGVNDSPALKQANVGIAVDGATDAARAAASLVLTAPGLSVIIKGIEEARRIFERMNTYAIYRIAETIRVLVFLVLSILMYNFYPVSAFMLILLSLLNDIPIMTIAYDRAPLPQRPVRWNMPKVMTIASLLGGIGVISSFFLLVIATSWLHLPFEQLQSIIFLKLSLAGHQMLFVVRSRGPFWAKPFPSPILLGAILSTQIMATLCVGLGLILPQVAWGYIGAMWLYAFVWMVIVDRIKLVVYRCLGNYWHDE